VKVVSISPRGYCPGVVNAINTVNRVIRDPEYPRPIYLLGMIVHNQQVMDRFQEKGVIALEDNGLTRMQMLDSIQTGTVIITAHGVGDDVFVKIREKGLRFVDATCKEVYKTHDLVKKYLLSGYQVVYLGKANHPETEGILSLDPTILLVEDERDARKLIKTKKPVFVTNQTTLSIKEIEPIVAIIKTQFPYAMIAEEICSSTRVRQEAILKMNQGVDLCIVVGDPRSNNTASLVKISREGTHTRTHRISSVRELTPELLKNVQTVSVTSGASTPTEITNAVIRFLENYQG
jgi:4-hydroxy-3-methylbut-2-enyl diphosphate reductase